MATTTQYTNTSGRRKTAVARVYLSEGTHTMTLKVINNDVRDVYHRLVTVLNQINDLAREVNKITGVDSL